MTSEMEQAERKVAEALAMLADAERFVEQDGGEVGPAPYAALADAVRSMDAVVGRLSEQLDATTLEIQQMTWRARAEKRRGCVR